MMKNQMVAVMTGIVLTFLPGMAQAHFGMLIPSVESVGSPEEAKLDFQLMFAHPFEGSSMNMEKPERFGVWHDGEDEDLSAGLSAMEVTLPADTGNSQAWQAQYQVRRPGSHVFYFQPQPYWEPVEDSYIVHYTKVVVDAFGKEDGWDAEVGLKTEIVPLTRPFGLYAGNVFQGIVKVDGQPVPYSEVEIEYYNQDGESKAPRGHLITQVVKCDANGVFTYGIPRSGWWGFAGLNTSEETIRFEDEDKAVEIGAVLWVYVRDMN